MSENKTSTLRKKITADFLRTIIWIDDEIVPNAPDKLGDPFRTFFYPISREFQDAGFLIHLHPFNRDSSGEDDLFSSDSQPMEPIINLAKKADVIILDWHLGTTTPEYSAQIIKALANDPASRFVVILSQYADGLAEEMKTANLIRPAQDEENPEDLDSLFTKKENNHWVSNNGIHLIGLSKHSSDDENKKRKISAAEIIDQIHQLISSSYPDYLHWATLEIASKIRSRIPAWLQAIPRDTDIAILGELLSSTTEARGFIPEFLLDDLFQISKSHELTVLGSQNVGLNDWVNKPYAIMENPSSKEDKFVHFSTEISKIEHRDIKKIQSQTTNPNTEHFLHSHASFTQFCENVSGQAEDAPPAFGTVYKKTSEDTFIYICISQPCDCLRKEKLILIKGFASDDAKQGTTLLAFQGQQFRFDAEAENLSIANVTGETVSRRLTNFQRIGQLRFATANRIVSRFLGSTTRPAVNLPNFARKGRDKE